MLLSSAAAAAPLADDGQCVSLALFDRVLAERTASYDAKIATLDKMLTQALDFERRTRENDDRARSEDLNHTRADLDKRIDALNEMRAQLKDAQALNIGRAEVEGRLHGIEQRIIEIGQSLTEIRSRSEGANALWGYIVAGLGVVFGLFATIMRLRAGPSGPYPPPGPHSAYPPPGPHSA